MLLMEYIYICVMEFILCSFLCSNYYYSFLYTSLVNEMLYVACDEIYC